MHRALLSSAGLLALIVPVPSSAAPPADSIEYALADTLLQLKLDLVLESCGEPSISPRDLGEPFLLKPTLTVTPEARGSLTAENRFRVSGADLASWWTKRDVALALNDNGTLKSVGVTSENRGPAIIGNIIKLGTAAATLGLVPFLSGPAIPPPPQCTPELTARTKELNAIRRKIRNLQTKLVGELNPVAIRNTKEAIDRLAARAGELRSGPDGPLFLSLTKKIAPPSGPGSITVSWDADDFKTWFPSQADQQRAVNLTKLQIEFAAAPPFTAPVANNPMPAVAKGHWPYIAVREPVLAKITVTPVVPMKGFDEAQAKGTVWIGQWGGKSYYNLRAGFGESKKLALELDPFGRKTSMTVNRDARAESITGGLAGIADAAIAFQAATSDTHQQELRIKELETQQKYNKIMLCEAVIEEGGYTCPE